MKKLNLSLAIEEMKTILSETQGNQLCQGLVGWNISKTSKNADGWLLGMSGIKLFLPWSRWYFEPPSRSLLLWCLKYIPNFWHKKLLSGHFFIYKTKLIRLATSKHLHFCHRFNTGFKSCLYSLTKCPTVTQFLIRVNSQRRLCYWAAKLAHGQQM